MAGEGYTNLEEVQADYAAQQRLQERVSSVWADFQRITLGPECPNPRYPHSTYRHLRYEHYDWHRGARPVHRYWRWFGCDAGDVRLAEIDVAAGTMEVQYPGDDSYEPEYKADIEPLPLDWLWRGDWQEELTAQLADTHARSEKYKAVEITASQRAEYERLKQVFDQVGGAT